MAIFDSGTKTIFHQTSAPTGWTKETANYDNHALRIVNGSSLTSGKCSGALYSRKLHFSYE
jgi:hypothetical protein